MSPIVYRIATLLEQRLLSVPVGTNRGLLSLLFALRSGSVPLRSRSRLRRSCRLGTVRRNCLPVYKGKGRPPEYGECVRPLSRKRKGKILAATRPDRTQEWTYDNRRIRAEVLDNLVLRDAKPGSPSFRIVVIYDPRYAQPLVVATPLSVSAYALWRLYRDRWPIEQAPLAAKQRVGAERAFVFGKRAATDCRSWLFLRAISFPTSRRPRLRWQRGSGTERLFRRVDGCDGCCHGCILRITDFRTLP